MAITINQNTVEKEKVADSLTGTVVLLSKENIEETREQYSLTSAQEKYKQEILASGDIDALTAEVNIAVPETILNFGKSAADEMSKCADVVLQKYNMEAVDDTSKLVAQLSKLMDRIDMGELKGEEKGISKLFGTAKSKLEKIINKYKTIGSEMEGICAKLMTYENQIKSTNRDLNSLYEGAKVSYKELVKYILAGEQAIKEIDDYLAELQKQSEETNDPETSMQIQNVSQARTLMEQRVMDLRGAESVALQSIPTLKIMEYTNMNLSRKVNSAFIVTIPAFKTAMSQAVINKQQKMQAKGLETLDETTNKLLQLNAQSTVNNLKMGQKLASTSAIKVETIENTWNTIMNGIKEYKEMEKQYSQQRAQESQRIEQLNNQYLTMIQKGQAL